MILHTIYSLSINPYSIFLLTFEGIKDNLLIEYWNHKSGQMETLNVSKELLNDLNYYKIYSNAKGLASKDTQRQSPDGKTIFGTFIFSLSPTNINKSLQKTVW